MSIIPALHPDDIHNPAERKVYRALSKVADEWMVYYSLETLSRSKKGAFKVGELDFVIVVPDLGMLILEVKGGSIRCNQGHWFQEQRKMETSPFAQARNNRFKLENAMKRIMGDACSFGFPIAYGVCCPDIVDKPKSFGTEGSDTLFLTGREIGYIAEYIPGMIREFLPEDFRVNNTDLISAATALQPAFSLEVPLQTSIELIKAKRFRFATNQLSLLNFIQCHSQAIIEGGPGTGKTILAVHKARELASLGKRVLLLCYNKALGNLLREETSEETEFITATNYHELAWRMIEEQDSSLEIGSGSEFWVRYLPSRFEEVLRTEETAWDALIVDEAQDFKMEYWDSLKPVMDRLDTIYIFTDSDQNIYATRELYPIQGPDFKLEMNYRNTKSIADYIDQITGSETLLGADIEQGPGVEEVHCSSSKEVLEAIEEVLNMLLVEEDLKPEQVVILGGHSMKNTSLGSEEVKLGRHRICLGDQEISGAVPYYSYMAYKGCEAEVVLCIDVNSENPRWNKQGLFIACSRARTQLWMIFLD